jgi:hypothetical protein
MRIQDGFRTFKRAPWLSPREGPSEPRRTILVRVPQSFPSKPGMKQGRSLFGRGQQMHDAQCEYWR